MMIGGVQVRFPCKPYPSQTQMMFKVSPGLHVVSTEDHTHRNTLCGALWTKRTVLSFLSS